MRHLTKDQRSDDWEIARKGRVTASAIGKCMAGKNTKGRYEYMMQLIMDLEGIADFRDSAPWFEAGRKYEAHARGWYNWERQTTVQEVGFILHPEWNWFGASPDGLVGIEGMVEFKYRKTLQSFEEANTKPIPRSYEYQMQAQMSVCGRQWIDYCNYWRDDKTGKEQGHIRRLFRDDGQILELEQAAMLFWKDTVNTYRHRTKKDYIEFPFDAIQRKRERKK